jgi:hypothetical protein
LPASKTAVSHGAVRLVVAAVALPNEASVARHRSLGFREVGTFTGYAATYGQPVSSTCSRKRRPRRPVADARDGRLPSREHAVMNYGDGPPALHPGPRHAGGT